MGVEEACDLNQRGGFDWLVSSGEIGAIQFDIYYRESPGKRPITYELSEETAPARRGQSTGWPLSFLYLKGGEGLAWSGEGSFEGKGEESG